VRNAYPPWSTLGGGSAGMVDVETQDPWFVPGGTYVVAALLPPTPDGGGGATATATATLLLTLSTAITPLIDGIATQGWAREDGEYSWYLFTVVSIDVAVRIALSPMATAPGGGVDLFVSSNSSNTRPTGDPKGGANAACHGGLGEDCVLELPWAALPECPGSSVAEAILCHVFVGVRARGGAATFTVLGEALKENATAILLLPGTPQFNVVRASDTVQYYALVNVPPGMPYYLLLNPHGVGKVYAYATTDGSRPSPTNPAAVSTLGSNGPREILFAPPSPAYNSSTTLRVVVDCPFIPAGGAVGFDLLFDIGEDSTATPLAPSLPLSVEVQVGHTRYFSLTLPGPPREAAAAGGIDFFLSAAASPPTGPLVFLGPAAPPGNASFHPGPTGGACLASGVTSLWHAHVDPTGGMGGGACACPPLGACRYVLAVACPGIPFTQPACMATITATLGSPAPVALSPGQGFGAPLDSAAGNALFFLDLTAFLAWGSSGSGSSSSGSGSDDPGSNLTLSVLLFGTSGGSARLLGTAAPSWVAPSPANAAWDSATTGPAGLSAFLTLSPWDPIFAACPTCTLLCLSLSAMVQQGHHQPSPEKVDPPQDPPPGYILTADTPLSLPTQLTLNLPTPATTAGYRSIHRFVLWLASPLEDLVVSVAALAGSVAFTLDAAPASTAACAVSRPGNVVTCSGTWASFSAGSIRVPAGDPCADANALAAAPCNATRDWGGGRALLPYALSVLVTISPTTFIVTASQGGVLEVVNGEPYPAACGPSFPALFGYMQEEEQQEQVHFLLTSGSIGGLTAFLLSCNPSSDPGCTAAAMAASPPRAGDGRTNTALLGTLDPNAALAASYTPPAAQRQTYYFIAVYAPPACAPPTCSAPVTLLAQSGSSSPLDIPAAFTSGRTASLSLALPAPVLAIFLPPPTPPSSHRAFPYLAIELQGCSSALPLALYLCDPGVLPRGAPGACWQPFAPSPHSFTATNATSAGTAWGASSATLLRAASAAPIVYLGILPAEGGAQLAGAQPEGIESSLVLRVRSWAPPSPPPLQLLTPSAAVAASLSGLLAAPAAGPPGASTPATTTLTLSFPAVHAGLNGAPSAQPPVAPLQVPPQALNFTAYLAVGGFAGLARSGGCLAPPPTPCGLSRWGAACGGGSGGSGALVVPLRQLQAGDCSALQCSVTLPPLQAIAAGTLVEFFVVAACDASHPSQWCAENVPVWGKDEVVVGMGGAVVGGGSSASALGDSGSGALVVASGVLAVVVALAGGGVLWGWWWRRGGGGLWGQGGALVSALGLEGDRRFQRLPASEEEARAALRAKRAADMEEVRLPTEQAQLEALL
jgi:hypothetical protein